MAKLHVEITKAAILVLDCAGRATDDKTRRQLADIVSLLYDRALCIRTGTMRVPEKAVPVCMEEIDETAAAAESANDDAAFARVVVEGNEALHVIDTSSDELQNVQAMDAAQVMPMLLASLSSSQRQRRAPSRTARTKRGAK